MPSAKLSVVPRLCWRAAAVLLQACSSTRSTTRRLEPQQDLCEAKDELNSGAYDKAIPLFEKLEGRAAGTPLAQQAQLDKAYAHYKER
jgi:outer membrane protein assembly factor BamD